MALFSRCSHHKPKKWKIPFSNRRLGIIFQKSPKRHGNPVFKWGSHHKPKKRKSRFQIEDTGIIFQKSPKRHGNPVFKWGSHHKPRKKHGNSVFKYKILALFSRGSHHKPKKREIPFSNRRYWHYFPEVPITSPKKRKSRFQIEDIGIIFQKSLKRHGNPVFKWGSHHKPGKNTEIPFSNRRYWHYFPEVAITTPKKTTEIPFSNRRYWHYFPEIPITSPKKGKSRFQIEDIGIIFQKSPKRHGNPVFKWGSHHKPRQNTEIPFSNRRYWYYFPEVAITSQKKTTEIPFSKRRYWHYFPEVLITSPKKREIPFSNRRYWHYFPEVPITSPKRHGNPVFKWGSHHKPRKNTEIPFSNRRYWHYFPEVPITSPKKGKSRFQIEDTGIFSRKAQKDTEIPFSNEVAITSPEKTNGNPVFK